MKKLRPNRMTGKWFVCTICGKKYYKTKSQIKNCSGKYCSSECYWNYLKKHTPKHLIEINKKKYLLPIKCKLCGKLFKPVNAKQKYCCSICYHKATTTLKEIVCPNCGKLFKPTVFTQTYCSKECANKRERKNWNSWKKGKPLSKENASNIQKALIEHYDRVGRKSRRKKHSLYEYNNWTKQIMKRDSYTCQECGKVGGKLQAHHIKSWAKYPELRYELSNGITLCPNCHWKKHPKMSKKMFGI